MFFSYVLPIMFVQFIFAIFIGKKYYISCDANDFLATVIRYIVSFATGIFLSYNAKKRTSFHSASAYFLSILALAFLFYSKRLYEFSVSLGVMLPTYLVTEIIPFLVFGYATGCAMSGGKVRKGIKALLYSSLTAAVLLSILADNAKSVSWEDASDTRFEEKVTEMDVHLLFLQCGKKPISVKIVCRDIFSCINLGSYLPKSKNLVSEKTFFHTDRSITVFSPILPETLFSADLVIIDFAKGENEAEKYVLSEEFLLKIINENPGCTIAVRNTPENALAMKKVFFDRAIVTGYDRTWLVGGKKTTSSVKKINARAEEAQEYCDGAGSIPSTLFSIVADEIRTSPENGGEDLKEKNARLFVGSAIIAILAVIYFIVRFALTGKPGRKEIFLSFENGLLFSLILTFLTAFSVKAGDGQGLTVFAVFLLCTALGFVSANANKKDASSDNVFKNSRVVDAILPVIAWLLAAVPCIYVRPNEYRTYFFLLMLAFLVANGRTFGNFVNCSDEKTSPAALFTGFTAGAVIVYAFLANPVVPICAVAAMLLIRCAAQLLNGKA